MGREQPSQSQMAYTVEQLVAVNPYNPDILPDLENYVNEQVSMQTYSLDANLCLLRLYQFEPERMSTQIVAHILIKDISNTVDLLTEAVAFEVSHTMSKKSRKKPTWKRHVDHPLGGPTRVVCGKPLPKTLFIALMAMPAPDFSLCLFLIPERVQMDEQFKTLIVLSHYLETAKFRQFWDEAAKSRHILEVVPGFEQAIQEYAVHVLSLTYQKVPRSVIAEAINMEGLSLDKFVEHHVANSGWIVEKGQLVSLPRNEFNHPELRRSSADIIPLDHITRIFPVLG